MRKHPVSIALSNRVLQRIDQEAQKQKRSRSEYVELFFEEAFFTTVNRSYTEEYWLSLTVRKADHYYAEIGLDIGYNRLNGQWHTYAYAVYSHDSYSGTLIGTFDMGYSTSAPAIGNVQVRQSSGSTWVWSLGGTQFASHTYPEDWYGEAIISETEAYNQPAAHTANQQISSVTSIIGMKSDGTWTTAPHLSPVLISPGWMVTASAAGNGYHSDSSTRT